MFLAYIPQVSPRIVGTAEFVTKPFMCLTSLRQGMGDLWSNVSEEELA